MDQINTDMRIFMRAERQIEETMEDYERKYRWMKNEERGMKN